MKKLQKIGTWYCLLSKRFFKKYSFYVILLMIPFLVKGMQQIAEQKSGMMKIVLWLWVITVCLTAAMMTNTLGTARAAHWIASICLFAMQSLMQSLTSTAAQ